MLKKFLKFVSRVGELQSNKQHEFYSKIHQTSWKEVGLPDLHSEDNLVGLKQEFSFQDDYYIYYSTLADRYRVYMPLRKNDVEVNTKYMTKMIQIVSKYCTYLVIFSFRLKKMKN